MSSLDNKHLTAIYRLIHFIFRGTQGQSGKIWGYGGWGMVKALGIDDLEFVLSQHGRNLETYNIDNLEQLFYEENSVVAVPQGGTETKRLKHIYGMLAGNAHPLENEFGYATWPGGITQEHMLRLAVFITEEPNYIIKNIIMELLIMVRNKNRNSEFFKDFKSSDETNFWKSSWEKTKASDLITILLDIENFPNKNHAYGESEFNPKFLNQESTVIEQIKKAKYMIWIAMYTFTNKTIFENLLKKQSEGLNIQLIVHDYKFNRISGIKYELVKDFMYHPPFGSYKNNLMHKKCTIIDLETVIDGSYNFTKNAEYNKENLYVIKSKENAVKYADEFMKLKTGIINSTLSF